MRPATRFVMIAMCFLLGFRALSAQEKKIAARSEPRADTHQSLIAERDAIFREIAKSDAAKIISCAVSHSKHSWGLDLVAASDRLEAFCATNLLCPPHPLGWSDLTDIAVIGLTQAIRPRIDQIDGALFGRDAAYEVTLWDSPSLRKNLELLSRLPELSTLLIYTDRKDNELWPLIRKVHVTDFAVHDLAELGSHDASVSGIVVDRRGGPVHGGWVTISSRTGRELCSIGLNDDGKFTANGLPSVAYQLHACGVPSSSSSLDVFLGRGVEVKESEPVDAKPGDKNVRIVLDVADASKKLSR